jgi:hypothetical protein
MRDRPFSHVGCLANLSADSGIPVTTCIEKGGTWLPCPSSCKSLQGKLWGECLSFPPGNWGSVQLSLANCAKQARLEKKPFLRGCLSGRTIPLGSPSLLEQSLMESLGATQTSLGTNSSNRGGKTSICLQWLFSKLGFDSSCLVFPTFLSTKMAYTKDTYNKSMLGQQKQKEVENQVQGGH